MKIALITTQAELIENSRIQEEIVSCGHQFKLIDLYRFSIALDQKTKSLLDDAKDCDIAIVRGVFLGQKVIATLVSHLKKYGVKVFDNNFLEHRYSIDKLTDLVKLSLNGINIPKTYHTRVFEDYFVNANKIGYPVVVKSTRTGKGRGVFKISSDKELEEFISNSKTNDKEAKNYIMQEYIPYKHDLRVLIIGGHQYCMKRIPQNGEFRANFSLGGEVETFNLDVRGKLLATEALKTIGMSVGGVDVLITDDDKRYILEVNHTPGFVGMEEATGVNIGKVYVEHAIKEATR